MKSNIPERDDAFYNYSLHIYLIPAAVPNAPASLQALRFYGIESYYRLLTYSLKCMCVGMCQTPPDSSLHPYETRRTVLKIYYTKEKEREKEAQKCTVTMREINEKEVPLPRSGADDDDLRRKGETMPLLRCWICLRGKTSKVATPNIQKCILK